MIELVIVNGWAMPGSVWSEWIDRLGFQGPVRLLNLDAVRSEDEWLRYLEREVRHPSLIVGWSLGGQLALSFAHHYPERVLGLLLLTSTPKFVQSEDWQDAQPLNMLENMQRLVSLGSNGLIRRFAMLQTVGTPGAKETSRKVEQMIRQNGSTDIGATVYDKKVLQSGLDLLAQLDLRDALARLAVPTHVVLGAQDQVVRVKPAALTALNAQVSAACIEGMGHFPFLQYQRQTLGECARFFSQWNTSAGKPCLEGCHG